MILYWEENNDILLGGKGNDKLYGGDGKDTAISAQFQCSKFIKNYKNTKKNDILLGLKIFMGRVGMINYLEIINLTI